MNNLEINQSLKNPTPKAIAIFDDVITSGASFKAAQSILEKNFPGMPMIGIFVARRVQKCQQTNW